MSGKITWKQFVDRMQDRYVRLHESLTKAGIESGFRMIRQGKLNATTYPKVRTGMLRSSIAANVGWKGSRLLIDVHAGYPMAVRYAPVIEYGSNARNIKPRFFLRRAVNLEKKRFAPVVAKIIKQNLKGA